MSETTRIDVILDGDGAERVNSKRTWAAIMLARDIATCESILLGRKVMASKLDGEVLRRALRGGELPDPLAFVEVTPEMLDAVDESGALPSDQKRRKR